MAPSISHTGQASRNSFTLRSPPSRDVHDDTTLAECYADFILFCNPAIRTETNTLDLKTLFTAPPKSDGKSFSIFRLYQLICKLELKEIKTWAELALELGVEPPDPAKGQSPQKVQQYAVRLKRWMHAMHVDAFFEYLRGQSHAYWMQIPTQNNPVPNERDGVPNEEDLALRALLPETRPKRGRKRVEETGADLAGETSNIARRRRVGSYPVPPESAREPAEDPRADVDDARKMLEARLEAWAAADHDPLGDVQHRASEPQLSVPSPSDFHRDRRLTHPVYQNPASKSPNVDPLSPLNGESVDSPSTAARTRRKTGTAVSSAWRSSSAVEGGKLRGRPPSNRHMSDGPYTTFPVIPEPKPSQNALPVESAGSANAPTLRSEFCSSALAIWSNPNIGTGENGARSHNLRLPPLIQDRPARNGSPHYQPLLPLNTPSPSGFTPTTFTQTQWRPSTVDITRQHSIPDGSATDESPATTSFSAPSSRPQLELQDDTNVDVIELSYLQSVLGAEWLDKDGDPAPPADADEAMRIVKAMITYQWKNAQSDDAFLLNVATMAGARLLIRRLQLTRTGQDEANWHYTSVWKLQYGPVQGSTVLKCSVPKPDRRRDSRDIFQDEMLDTTGPEVLEASEPTVDWKKKYAELHQRTVQQSEKLKELKSTVLNGVLQAKDYI